MTFRHTRQLPGSCTHIHNSDSDGDIDSPESNLTFHQPINHISSCSAAASTSPLPLLHQRSPSCHIIIATPWASALSIDSHCCTSTINSIQFQLHLQLFIQPIQKACQQAPHSTGRWPPAWLGRLAPPSKPRGGQLDIRQ